jgi:pimeloyl-ACP methyl ester carboxylesterase
VILLVLLGSLIAAGLIYQALGAYSDARRFPAPGRLFDVGACRLHINEQGSGSPAVVLESGIAASSLSWALVQPAVAEFARVCSYDRAGLSWSDRCKTPRTLHKIILELESLLSQAGVSGPYVLVGHSFGGIVIRAFAHLHPDQIAGLIFVDPVPVEYWANCRADDLRRLRIAARLSRRGALLARLGVVRAALVVLASGRKRLPQFIAQLSAGQGREVIARLVGEVQKLPQELWPLIRSHWSCP